MSSNNPDGSGVTPSPTGEKSGEKRSLRSFLFVAIVLLVGIIVGMISFLLVAPHIAFAANTPFGQIFFPPPGSIFPFLAWHIILSTVSIALLISLVVVYGKTYSQTRARFALGICIVLLALLLEGILNYPIMQLYFGTSPDTMSVSTNSIADVFTIFAYTVFLYLSLE